MYHTPYGHCTNVNIDASERRDKFAVGERVWLWSYGSRMSKNSVGIVVQCIHAVGRYGDKEFRPMDQLEIQNLNSEMVLFFPENTVRLTNDEYADVIKFTK